MRSFNIRQSSRTDTETSGNGYIRYERSGEIGRTTLQVRGVFLALVLTKCTTKTPKYAYGGLCGSMKCISVLLPVRFVKVMIGRQTLNYIGTHETSAVCLPFVFTGIHVLRCDLA